VTPVNDAPVNSVPGTQSVNDNTDLVFSSTNGNLISISDVDADGGIESITLGAGFGTLTLGTQAGLDFVSGNGSGSVTLSGALAALNDALDGLTYHSVTNFDGADTLTITTDDQGNSGARRALRHVDTVTIN